LNNREIFKGSGIGLASCKKIINNYGGKIWFTANPEKGTTFFFSIPKKSISSDTIEEVDNQIAAS